MNFNPFHVIIPARFDSQRLPGKTLRGISGKPLIQWVYESVEQSSAKSITVATDDQRIVEAVAGFGGDACMTSADHESGTDRVAEAARKLGLMGDAVIVNVQGDEPQIPAALIEQVAQCLLDHPEASIATACEAIESPAQWRDHNVVKVVMDENGYALYFSRAPIPHSRDGKFSLGQRHIGIYAYRMSELQRFTSLAVCKLEQIEKLEQLRALWHGDKIAVCEAVEAAGIGIDTEEDLAEFQRIINI